MRGIKYIIGTLLAAVVLSQLSVLGLGGAASSQKAYASSIPTTLQALYTARPNAKDNVDTYAKHLIEYYDNNVGNGAASLKLYQGQANEAESLKLAYHDLYSIVEALDKINGTLLDDYACTAYSGHLTKLPPALIVCGSQFEDNVARFASNIASLDGDRDKMLDLSAALFAGTRVVTAMGTNPSFSAAAKAQLIADQSNTIFSRNPVVFTEVTHDLDTYKGTERPDTYLGGNANFGGHQSKYLKKAIGLGASLLSSKIDYGGSNSNLYTSSDLFYADMVTLFNNGFDTNPATDDASIAANVALMNVAASAYDATLSAATTKENASSSTNNRCGAPANGIFEISKAIQQGFCGIVDTIQGLSIDLLQMSSYLVAKMLPLTPLPKSPATAWFFNTLIPNELAPQYIQSTLSLPFVTIASNLIIRMLGIFLIVMLMILAFANILQIQVNTYSIKKMLPGLIFGYILALSGNVAVRASVEASNYVTSFIFDSSISSTKNTGNMDTLVAAISSVGGKLDPVTNAVDTNAPLYQDYSKGPDMGLVLQQGVLNLLIIAAAIMLFVLGFLLLVRSVIFIFLAPLSPIAFFGITAEIANPIWKRWWKTFIGWIAMPAVAAFWIWLALQAFTLGDTGATGGTPAQKLSTGVIGYAIGMVAIYLAMTTPFKLAGEAKIIYNRVQKGVEGLPGTMWKYTGNELVRGGKAKVMETRIGDGLRWIKKQEKIRDEGIKLSTEQGISTKAAKKRAKKDTKIAALEYELSKTTDPLKRMELEAKLLWYSRTNLGELNNQRVSRIAATVAKQETVSKSDLELIRFRAEQGALGSNGKFARAIQEARDREQQKDLIATKNASSAERQLAEGGFVTAKEKVVYDALKKYADGGNLKEAELSQLNASIYDVVDSTNANRIMEAVRANSADGRNAVSGNRKYRSMLKRGTVRDNRKLQRAGNMALISAQKEVPGKLTGDAEFLGTADKLRKFESSMIVDRALEVSDQNILSNTDYATDKLVKGLQWARRDDVGLDRALEQIGFTRTSNALTSQQLAQVRSYRSADRNEHMQDYLDADLLANRMQSKHASVASGKQSGMSTDTAAILVIEKKADSLKFLKALEEGNLTVSLDNAKESNNAAVWLGAIDKGLGDKDNYLVNAEAWKSLLEARINDGKSYPPNTSQANVIEARNAIDEIIAADDYKVRNNIISSRFRKNPYIVALTLGRVKNSSGDLINPSTP
jgi:hypothetical protein